MVCLDDAEALAFVGGELPPERLPHVIAHADACVACQELIAGLCALGDDRDVCGREEIVAAGHRIDGGDESPYRATESALDRPVWLVVPRPRARAAHEIATRAELVHPHIAPLLATGTLGDGRSFYTLPRTAGISLAAAQARARNRSERLRLLPHVIDVAVALAYAHAHGHVHGALEAHHVIVDRYGATAIVEWGPGGEPRADAIAVRGLVEQVIVGRLTSKAAAAALARAPQALAAICKRDHADCSALADALRAAAQIGWP